MKINNKEVRWSEEKNILLQEYRSLSFEMLNGKIPLLFISQHNPEKYPRQDAFIFNIDEYPIFVPFVEEDDYIFLKNMIPKREYKYLISKQ